MKLLSRTTNFTLLLELTDKEILIINHLCSYDLENYAGVTVEFTKQDTTDLRNKLREQTEIMKSKMFDSTQVFVGLKKAIKIDA